MTSGFFIWKNKTFIKNYENTSAANFGGKFESYGISNFEAVDIDNYEDLFFAENFLSGQNENTKIKYHPLVSDLIKNNLIQPN